MKRSLGSLLFILLLSAILGFKLRPSSIRHRHLGNHPSRSLKKKLKTIQTLFAQNVPTNPRKLADPFTDLVYTGHKILESSIYSDTKYQNISAGKIGMVLPRDAPTMVVNELPLQRFYLNKRDSLGGSSPHFTGLQMHTRVLEAASHSNFYSHGFI